jgi:hypothetical protein
VVTVEIDPAAVQQARGWVPSLRHDRAFEVVAANAPARV